MNRLTRNPLRPPCANPAFPALQAWYRGSLGQVLQREELAALSELLPTLFGYHLVLLDPPWTEVPVDACRIRNAWISLSGPGRAGQFVVNAGSLPVRTDSLDGLILPHVLEFAPDPHAILREADRCLVAEGHLILFGFQPWGLWGVRHLLSGWRGQAPWCGRWLGVSRVRDWCRLLGFDVLEIRSLCHSLPLAREGGAPRVRFLERASQRGWPLPSAGWMMLARKRVIGLTPVRPRWRPRRSILSPLPGMAEPTRRSLRK